MTGGWKLAAARCECNRLAESRFGNARCQGPNGSRQATAARRSASTFFVGFFFAASTESSANALSARLLTHR